MFLLTVKRSPSCNFLHIPIFMGVLEIHLNRERSVHSKRRFWPKLESAAIGALIPEMLDCNGRFM
jgi:hypothetical protein